MWFNFYQFSTLFPTNYECATNVQSIVSYPPGYLHCENHSKIKYIVGERKNNWWKIIYYMSDNKSKKNQFSRSHQILDRWVYTFADILKQQLLLHVEFGPYLHIYKRLGEKIQNSHELLVGPRFLCNGHKSLFQKRALSIFSHWIHRR